MSDRDFEEVFRSLGLESKKGTQTTFLPLSDDTIISGPREAGAAVALTSTLPRLHLASPDAAHAPADAPELIPKQLLGEGGMGQVLLAHQTALNRDVAVKVLKPSVTNAAAAEALVHEARTAGGLEHPGVVPIYALARDAKGLPALVMKRVEGLSWRELMHAPEHPSWSKLLLPGQDRLAFQVEVLVQVCNAIAHAHQRGVLHRDVKPANVLLGELGEVYLADWGVAATKTYGHTEGERVRLVGTAAYLAPEMVSGQASKMDERTDVYLLGATLHELLTGAPPHAGADLHTVLHHAFLGAEPVLPAGAPPLLAAACKRALARDPALRFPSATALRDELKRFLQHRSSSALAQAATERLQELERTPEEASAPFDERRWNALVFECRFGFTQALKDTPDHSDARDGLRRCLEVAARREISRGSAATARAFLAELEAPPKELAESLARLEARDAERAADAARLTKLRHELDPQVSLRQRRRVTLLMAGAVMALSSFFALGSQRDEIAVRYEGWFRVVPMSIVVAAFAVASLVGRRSLFSTRINRDLMALVGVATFGTLAQRIASVLVGIPAAAGMVEDSIYLTGISTLGALTYHRGFALPAAIFLGTAFGEWQWPQYAMHIFGFGSGAAIVAFTLVFGVWRKDVGRRRV